MFFVVGSIIGLRWITVNLIETKCLIFLIMVLALILFLSWGSIILGSRCLKMKFDENDVYSHSVLFDRFKKVHGLKKSLFYSNSRIAKCWNSNAARFQKFINKNFFEFECYWCIDLIDLTFYIFSIDYSRLYAGSDGRNSQRLNVLIHLFNDLTVRSSVSREKECYDIFNRDRHFIGRYIRLRWCFYSCIHQT